MGLTARMIAKAIAWERWRLRHNLENVARAQTVESMAADQANADSALARLVSLGCDEAEELKRARS